MYRLNGCILSYFNILENILVLLGALVAEILGTIAGFGSSSIFMPIVSQFLTFHNALLLVAIYHIFGNMSRLSMFYTHRNKKIFFLFGVPSIIATVGGALLASHLNQDLLKSIFGLVLFLYASYSLFSPQLSLRGSTFHGIIGGLGSGFSAGIIGTGGVLRGAFMQLFKLPKEEYLATIASVALLVDFTRIPVYFNQGFAEGSYYYLVPFLFVVAFVGSWLGKKIVKMIPQNTFRKLIYLAIIVASLLMFYQGWNAL